MPLSYQARPASGSMKTWSIDWVWKVRSSTRRSAPAGVDLGADLVAVIGGPLRVGAGRRRHRPVRTVVLLIEDRKGPSGEHRRIDVLGLRRRAGDAHEARGRVGLSRRPGRFRAPKRSTPARELDRLLGEREAGEIVPDQERDRLAEIERRLAGRAEEIAGVEARHGDPGRGKIVGEHDAIGRRAPGRASTRSMPSKTCVASGVLSSMACAVCARPAGHVLRAEIGGVELGAGHLRPAVDAARRRRRCPSPRGAGRGSSRLEARLRAAASGRTMTATPATSEAFRNARRSTAPAIAYLHEPAASWSPHRLSRLPAHGQRSARSGIAVGSR